MFSTKAHEQEYNQFMENWKQDPLGLKKYVTSFVEFLSTHKNILFEFNARPGISYSVKVLHANTNTIAALIDTVDDEPEARWLSVCFYDAQITDPGDIGDWVPQGLFGKDARCFNVEESDDKLKTYIETRLEEACLYL